MRQVCYIFGLDSDMKGDVDVMKRGLLKLLMVREFAEQAQFVNPSRCCMCVFDLLLASLRVRQRSRAT
jgi:hypothetical protein